MAGRLKKGAVAALSMVSVVATAQQAVNIRPLFTQDERIAVQEYWAEPDRYVVKYLPLPWQAVYSSEASVWLFKFYRACSKGGRVVPTLNPTPANEQQKRWFDWINQKYEFDRARAQEAALQANNDLTDSLNSRRTIAQPSPGTCPDDLVGLAGEPPKFWVVDKPHTYTVNFGDCSIPYKDNVFVRPKYPYFRYNIGVNSEGEPVKKLPASEMASLMTDAGLNRTESNVMTAVSQLEGGFDSVNTYDSGYVSVGLVQFATLKAGAGSLGRVLSDLKQHDPVNFQRDFRRFGVDVTENGVLSVVDIYTALEKQGYDANLQIIQDKRLVAVLQRAGQRRPFRIAQLRVARQMFYPLSDEITVRLNGRDVKGHVGDIVRSEAALATLMDRKVNTGGLAPLNAVLTEVASAHGAARIADLAKYEAEVMRRMKYRRDFSKTLTLTQPTTTPAVVASTPNSKKVAPAANKPKSR
jgi:hypothetical protein